MIALVSINFLINIGLVTFYWRVLLAEPIAAQLLALVPVIVANSFLLNYFVFRSDEIERPKASAFLNFGPICIAGLALYIAVAAMLLYISPVMFADDWRHYDDYFFNRSFAGSIFGRQNGHLMFLPNLVFYGNYMYLGGKTVVLAVVNVIALGLSAWISAWVVDRGLAIYRIQLLERLGVAFIILAIFSVLAAPSSQFLSMGVHNHLAVLGAVGAAWLASDLISRNKQAWIFTGFVLFALLSSTSFSTGSSAWALGFAGAVISKQRKRTITLYFVVGVLAALATLGYLSLPGSRTWFPATPKLIDLLLFVPAFLGNAVANFQRSGQSFPELFPYAVNLGLVGVALYCGLTLRVLVLPRQCQRSDLDKAYTFLWLVAGFVIIAGLLVGFGRAGWRTGLYSSLFPRFATWSTLFWFSLGAASILAVKEFSEWRQWTWKAGTVWGTIIAMSVLAINTTTISGRQIYKHSAMVDVGIQMALSTGNRSTEKDLFRGEEGRPAVQRVIESLRSRHGNIFAENWPYMLGNDLGTALHEIDDSCPGRFHIGPTSRSDEWKIRGWMWPSVGRVSSIKTIFLLNKDERVVGFAKPIFRSSQNSNSQYLETRPLTSEVIKTIRMPILSGLPGVSGQFRGRFVLSSENGVEVSTNLSIVGEDAVGHLCKLGKL